MLVLTKRVRFCCSHQLYKDKWDSDKNKEFFGRCSNLHGHNYILEVSVMGEVDPQTGMIINLNTLDKIIRQNIVDWVDHKNLNTDIEIFKEKLPTVENLVVEFWNKLEPALPSGMLKKLTLYETEDNKVEYERID